MSTSVLILGESGTGKSTSLRHLVPNKVFLIQVIRKPLPFRPKGWQVIDFASGISGNIFVTDNSEQICSLIQRTQKEIIVIDDFQYVMANEFMRRSKEKGYDKFTDIGRNAWNIFDLANRLPANKRVYILAHTQNDEFGRTKIKTIGKMLDEKVTLEGMATICLRTHVADGNYQFSTRNNGQDTVKAPIGLFEQDYIDNDLAAVDAVICDYYGISAPNEEPDEPITPTENQEEN